MYELFHIYFSSDQELINQSWLSQSIAKKTYKQTCLDQSRLFIDYTIVFLTDLSITDQFGRTPLHNAILGQHNLVVELLLSGGADVRVNG